MAASRVAVAGGVLTVVLLVATFALIVANGISIEVLARDETGGLVPFAMFGVVGAVVAAKRPRNPVGWLLLVVGLGMVVNSFGQQYAQYGYITRPGVVPAPGLGTWVQLAGTPAFVAMPLLLLVFPDGRPPSRRWWLLVGWLGVTATCAVASYVWVLVARGPELLTHVRIQDLELPVVVGAAGAVGYFGTLLAMLLAAVAVLVRFHRSRGDERQQLKWFAYAVLAAVVTAPLAELSVLGRAVSLTVLAGVPVAIGIAVVRYRLYDIDRIVRRTVTYALVSAVLVAVYAVGVVGAGGLVRSVTGGGHDLVVAATTLAATGLFRPVRRRVQAAVDRRFNRSQHDAGLDVAAFAQRLRDEVDLDTLRADLLATSVRTLQPDRSGLWLPAAASNGVRR